MVVVENENTSCCGNKQEMSQPSVSSGFQTWVREELGECKTQGEQLTPQSWGAYERNEFSEPRGLHLPKHSMLNSLTWCQIFAVQTACALCCKLVYILTSPPASLEPFSQSYFRAFFPSYWNAVSWTQESSTFPPNKITLYFQVVTVFFSRQ